MDATDESINIRKLEELGILQKYTERKRNVVYKAGGILSVLEA